MNFKQSSEKITSLKNRTLRITAVVFKGPQAIVSRLVLMLCSGILFCSLVFLGYFIYHDEALFGVKPSELLSFGADDKKDLLDVVAIADFSGPTKMVGQDLAQGFKDAVEQEKISEDVRLIIRDDRGDGNVVAALADGAAAGYSTLAVIGPTQVKGYDDMVGSLQEGMVPGLVPIGPPASYKDSQWIFSLQASQNRQGEFVASLLEKVQKVQSTVFVVSQGDSANGFINGYKKQQSLKTKSSLEVKILPSAGDKEALTVFLQSLFKYDAVVFSLPGNEAVTLVKGLRDDAYAGYLIGFGGASLTTFPELFKSFPKEQLDPGFYTNGLISATAFTPNMADEQARKLIKVYQKKYKDEPSWAYAFGYDSGVVLGNFFKQLKSTTPDWKALPPDEIRKKFATYLKSLNALSVSKSGFTGDIRFDQNNERDIPPTIVVYKSRIQVPYLFQYGTDASRFNFAKKLDEGQIQLDERVYDIVPVAYSGISPREISNINLEKRTFTAEFDIWFRSSVAIDGDDIQFPNITTDFANFIQLELIDTPQVKYRLFRYRGIFKFDTSPKDLAVGKLTLPILWRHKTLDATKLRLVIGETVGNKGRDLVEQMRRSEVVSPDMDYSVASASVAIENDQVNSLGNPSSLTGERSFSEIKGAFDLVNKNAMLGSYLSTHISWQWNFLFAALFALITLAAKVFKRRFEPRKKLAYLIFLEFGLASLFLTEVGLFASPILNNATGSSLVILQNSFTLIYYFGVAATFNLVVAWLLDRRESKKTAIQGSLKLLISVLVYSTAFGFFYSDVLKKDFIPVLAASSVILTVVGLALREIILDALGGIAIGLEGAVKPGDWIYIVSEKHELSGKVEELGWRNVRIHSRDGLVHFIPNSVFIQKAVANSSIDGGYPRVDIKFEISASANLAQIIELCTITLNNALVNDIFVAPSHSIRVICTEIDSEGAELEVQVRYRADQSRDALSTKVLEICNQVARQNNAVPNMYITIQNPTQIGV